MSRDFPTQKDNLIAHIEDVYGLDLSDEEYEKLRKFTEAQLFFIDQLLHRATQAEREFQRSLLK